MSTNLTPSNHSPQNSFTQLSTLHNWLTKIYNGMKQDKEYDDWVGYTLPEKVRNRYLQFFDDCKQSVQLKDIEIMIEYTKIKIEQYNNTQPIETKEVKETVHNKESNGLFIPYYKKLNTSPVYNSMSLSAQRVYVDLLLVAKEVEFSTNKKQFDYCYAHCDCMISKNHFYIALKELQDNGFIFITKTKLGKSNKISLSDYWMNRKPKNNKYNEFKENKNLQINNEKRKIGK